MVWNWNSLKSVSFLQFLEAFLNGARFDLSVIAVFTGLFLICQFWLEKQNFLRKSIYVLFTALNSVFFILNLIDSELINFTARRFTKSSLFLGADARLTNLVLPYLGMSVGVLIFIGLYIFLMRKVYRMQTETGSLLRKSIFTFVTLIAVVILARGGLQTKPLTFVDAKIFDNTFANNLVLNTSFTFIKSLGKSSFEKEHYFSNDVMLAYLNDPYLKSTYAAVKPQKMNVVLVILESFSKEYIQKKDPAATPFFHQLQDNGVSFTNSYANGRRSIEGIAALLSGIPALMEEPFINSEFSANEIIGLGTLLSAQDYHTSFFHGAKNGSMHFDQFTKSVGIKNYFGKSEYPNVSEDDDGTWGIYDEPFLKWMCQKLSDFPTPFFSTVFTLSSHQPFKIPNDFVSQTKEISNDMLKSIRYADHSLEQFMKCAASQRWYSNTLFIFTADHTGPPLEANASFVSRYEVPLLFFHPIQDVLKSLDKNQYAQHIDILPTVLETLGLEQKNKNYLARSLWQNGPKVIALYADGQYQLVGNVTDSENQLKAIKQYFSEGLFDNRLYYPSK